MLILRYEISNMKLIYNNIYKLIKIKLYTS